MIALLSKENVDNVIKIGKQLHPSFETLYDYNSLIDDINETYILIENNILYGFIHIQVICDEINIIDIVVDKNNRQKGYGKNLLEYVINKYNGKRFILEVSENNHVAISLYKKLGFNSIAVRKKYYDGDDAIIMERK